MKNNNKYRFFAFLGAFSLFSVSSFLFFSCNDDDSKKDDDKETKPIEVAGQYKLTSATLTSDTQLEGLKKGTDVSKMVKVAFFSVIQCTNENNIALDLKDNKELFFVCVGEDSTAKAGTWSLENEDTQLNLNLAPPLFSISYSLALKYLKVEDKSLSGSGLSLPVSLWIAEGSAPPANPLDPTNPKNALIKDFNVAFVFEKL